MKFYNVSVGKESKKGNFITNISFVCRTESNYNEVLNYYKEKYKGLDIALNNVEQIEDLEKIESKDTDYLGRTKHDREIESLNTKINKLKSSAKVSCLYSSLERNLYPAEAQKAILNFEELTKKAKEQKDIAIECIIDELSEKYEILGNSVQENKGFSSRNQSFSYKLFLDGELIKELEDNE